MKLKKLFLSAITVISITAYSQELPNKPTLTEVRSFNQSNLMKIEIGFTKIKVIEAMGGIMSIQTYTNKDPYTWARSKTDVIGNPYSRDLKTDKEGNSIEILWYFTDIKKDDSAITKDELTPIIFEKNLVVGMGWGFYEDYAKRKEITIDVR